eukprot:GHVT01047724.1.p1 GENE.GHVT01047724.1~~GHVT01047724.1.p1  ORF type:complete len:223 (-),score=49.56 GHVT01047724.1:950-1618(-)
MLRDKPETAGDDPFDYERLPLLNDVEGGEFLAQEWIRQQGADEAEFFFSDTFANQQQTPDAGIEPADEFSQENHHLNNTGQVDPNSNTAQPIFTENTNGIIVEVQAKRDDDAGGEGSSTSASTALNSTASNQETSSPSLAPASSPGETLAAARAVKPAGGRAPSRMDESPRNDSDGTSSDGTRTTDSPRIINVDGAPRRGQAPAPMNDATVYPRQTTPASRH